MDFALHLRQYLGKEVNFSLNDKNTLFTLDFSHPYLMRGTTVVIVEVNMDCILVVHPETQTKETIPFSRLNIVEPQ